MFPFVSFLTTGLARWLVLAVVLGVLLFGLRMHWKQQGRDELAIENMQAAVKIVYKQGAVTERVVIKYMKLAGATKVVTETIEKEVVKYAEAHPTALCLDADWRRLHDSAALNKVPAGAP